MAQDGQQAKTDHQKKDEAKPAGDPVADLQNQKALVDARKALAEAQTQTLLAKFVGDVKAGPYSGAIDMKDKAGTEEAALLAARAVREAATKVANAVEKATKGTPQPISVFASKEFPTFQRLLGLRARKELVLQAFAAIGIRQAQAEAEAVAPAAVVAGGLEALSKLLGFFKVDSTFGGAEVKVDESILLFAVAGRLAEQKREVHLPLGYAPSAQSAAAKELARELGEVARARARAQDELGRLDPAKDKARADALAAAIGVYDAFATAIVTVDANGTTPLALAAGELAVEAALKNGAAALLLRLESTGGGYLVTKNLATGLGSIPLYHMGGATVTYLLLDGPTGRVLRGDTIAVHGGFIRTDKIRAELQGALGEGT